MLSGYSICKDINLVSPSPVASSRAPIFPQHRQCIVHSLKMTLCQEPPFESSLSVIPPSSRTNLHLQRMYPAHLRIPHLLRASPTSNSCHSPPPQPPPALAHPARTGPSALPRQQPPASAPANDPINHTQSPHFLIYDHTTLQAPSLCTREDCETCSGDNSYFDR